MISSRLKTHLLCILLCVFCIRLLTNPALAANQVVTSNLDDFSEGTLGAAIFAVGDGEKITFNITSYTGNQDTVIVSGSALPFIKSMTIDGYNIATGNNVTVQVANPGSSWFPVFEITSNYSGITVSISNMTIKGGDVEGEGGGIYFYADSTLNLENVTISGSKADDGGGIYARQGSMTLIGCTISGNTANEDGGGVYVDMYATASFINCTISGNQQTELGRFGGGIFINDGVVNLTNCTIANNTASGYGGGVCSGAWLTVRNTIIANNTSNYGGADYYCLDDYDSLTDDGYNVVGYSNKAANAPAGFDNPSDTLYNTKYGQDGTSFESWTKNAVEVSGNLNLSATLADNGGPTQTLAFTGESFAAASATTGIPYGSSPYWNNSPSADQRGEARTANQNTSIGAYSENYASPPTHVALTGPATVLKDGVGAFTLTALNASDQPANVTENTTFSLSSSSLGDTFYSDAAGTASISSATISNGSSAVTFYARDNTFGTPTLTATRTGGMDLSNDTLDIRVSGNNALSFDGSDDYVQIDNTGTGVLGDNSANESFTIETWFKYNGSGGFNKIFAKHSAPAGGEYYGYTLENYGANSVKLYPIQIPWGIQQKRYGNEKNLKKIHFLGDKSEG